MSKSFKDIFSDMSNEVYKGDFDCANNDKINILIGAPKEVKGNF